MSIAGEASRAVRMTLVLWILTAIIYPLVILVVGQVFFPYQANGSIVPNLQGQPAGSALIGQVFTSDRYFQSRPSTTNYSSFTAQERDPENVGQTTGVSGASNYAPSNPALLDRIQGKDDPDPKNQIEGAIPQLRAAGIEPTADLVYTSGSSLDPHITLEAAAAQIARVAKTRNISPDEIVPLVNKHTQGRFLGIFGEPGVNVLKLNQELDVLTAAKK
ncbi:MAG: Potassium-transporting ATPase KdpC subunit [Chroococcidiopsis cubana SAG 39.79]|uniref:Potassium-transporting ATPase KdpC subunit n=1 Tax=Chroococcidiopsis cubana SAG 39.79 TaxID=388085 RepID=A0AB37UC15_9CYAN|nr:K(+)-transporting ATPase subunit C [Chroococcidiopsis cubana]MDZ4876931.1 Potassium-transporting ATPase KdpC subunit [Chroococcidiopsis cubana SAG 39.79]PSB63485.1 K(+)-transporting ATPase subunit C [Chroococcidiopsis cubana CCALA 043]RUT02655.1 potassium-transporting ATPase KdpC subunit [Chroococcidiopsis cubana SAG 39.79]